MQRPRGRGLLVQLEEWQGGQTARKLKVTEEWEEFIQTHGDLSRPHLGTGAFGNKVLGCLGLPWGLQEHYDPCPSAPPHLSLGKPGAPPDKKPVIPPRISPGDDVTEKLSLRQQWAHSSIRSSSQL